MFKISRRTVYSLSALFIATLLAAQAGASSCSHPKSSKSNAVSTIKADYDSLGKLQRLEYDRNGNGRIDTIAEMDGTRIVRIEIDSDENGSVDRWEYYTNGKLEKVGLSLANDGIADTWVYNDSKGQPGKIEISTNRDGKVNRTEFYRDGALIAAEEDSGAAGRVDKWESYSDGTLTKVAFDTGGHGKPDRRIVYGQGGAADRIEVDRKGDGIFEPLNERGTKR
jgi:hypothetical protein